MLISEFIANLENLKNTHGNHPIIIDDIIFKNGKFIIPSYCYLKSGLDDNGENPDVTSFNNLYEYIKDILSECGYREEDMDCGPDHFITDTDEMCIPDEFINNEYVDMDMINEYYLAYKYIKKKWLKNSDYQFTPKKLKEKLQLTYCDDSNGFYNNGYEITYHSIAQNASRFAPHS